MTMIQYQRRFFAPLLALLFFANGGCAQVQPTQTDYLKTPVPKKDVLEGEWSAWDSGKPKDWSKKAANPEFQEPTAMEKSKKVAATPEFQDPEAMVKK